MKHSWLSPSGFHAIVKLGERGFEPACVGKPFMEKPFPPGEPGPAAERGTRIHAYGQGLLLGEKVSFTDDTASEFNIALNYVDYIRSSLQDETVEMEVEKNLPVFPELEISGTGDCFAWLPKGTLHYFDLKTGRIAVSAEKNPQLLAYAEAFLKAHPKLICNEIVFHIYQPGNPQPPWSCSRAELTALISGIEDACIESKKVYDGEEVLHDRHLFVSDNCTFCRALSVCPAAKAHLEESSLALFDDEIPRIPNVSLLTHEQKVCIYKNSKLLQAFLAAIEESLRADVALGKDELVCITPGRTKRKWNPRHDVAAELTALGIEPYRTDLITITEAEKKLGKRKHMLPLEAFVTVSERDKLVVKNSNENREIEYDD